MDEKLRAQKWLPVAQYFRSQNLIGPSKADVTLIHRWWCVTRDFIQRTFIYTHEPLFLYMNLYVHWPPVRIPSPPHTHLHTSLWWCSFTNTLKIIYSSCTWKWFKIGTNFPCLSLYLLCNYLDLYFRQYKHWCRIIIRLFWLFTCVQVFTMYWRLKVWGWIHLFFYMYKLWLIQSNKTLSHISGLHKLTYTYC